MGLVKGRNPGKKKITPKRPTPQLAPKPVPGVAGGVRPVMGPIVPLRPTPRPQVKAFMPSASRTATKGPFGGFGGGGKFGASKPVGKPNSSNPRSPNSAPAVLGGGMAPAPAPRLPVGGSGGGASGGMGSSAPTGVPSPAPAAAEKELEKKISQADMLKSYMSTASDAVNAELLPALNELTRQIADLETRGAKATTETQQRGARTQADLGELFGRLGNFTGEVQKASNSSYEGLKTGMADIYSKLQGSIGSTYDGAQATSAAEANRLGLGQMTGAPEANANMERDQQFLQQLAGTDSAAAVGALTNSQSAFDQLMSMARNNAATEGTVRVGQSMRDTDKTLADIMFELEQGVRGLKGERGDIEATRGSKIRQMIDALQNRDYERNVDADDRAFQRDLANKKFGLEKQQVEASLIPQPAEMPSLLEQYNTDLKRLEYEDALAKRANPNADTDEIIRQILAKTGNPGKGGLFGDMFKNFL